MSPKIEETKNKKENKEEIPVIVQILRSARSILKTKYDALAKDIDAEVEKGKAKLTIDELNRLSDTLKRDPLSSYTLVPPGKSIEWLGGEMLRRTQAALKNDKLSAETKSRIVDETFSFVSRIKALAQKYTP